MEERIRAALARDRTVDITTIGRKTGAPRRIEIWYLRLGDKFYITGTPGPRDWYANLLTHPEFTFHLKGSMRADLPARAIPITDPAERRAILERLIDTMGRRSQLDAWVRGSPLVEVVFDGEAR
jgi:deazaflavin-dependent oxidoreductase (nitroreductase family)